MEDRCEEKYGTPMMSYQFRYIGEPWWKYERINMYESEAVHYVKIEFVHPVRNEIEIRTISKYGSEITNLDVLKYIENIRETENAYAIKQKNLQQMNDLVDKFKRDRYIGDDNLIRLVDLLLECRD